MNRRHFIKYTWCLFSCEEDHQAADKTLKETKRQGHQKREGALWTKEGTSLYTGCGTTVWIHYRWDLNSANDQRLNHDWHSSHCMDGTNWFVLMAAHWCGRSYRAGREHHWLKVILLAYTNQHGLCTHQLTPSKANHGRCDLLNQSPIYQFD